MQSHRLAIANEDWQVEARGLIARAQLLYLSDTTGRTEKAVALLNRAQSIAKAIKAEGDYAKAAMSLGCIFKDLGQPDYSQKHFDVAESFYTQRSAIHQVERIKRLKNRNACREIL